MPVVKKKKVEISVEEQIEKQKAEVPEKIAILPLRDTVVYPYMVAPLVIAREKSVKLIDDALAGTRMIGIVAQRKAEIDDPATSEIYEFGVAATILKMLKFPDGSIRLLIQGLTRIKIKKMLATTPYFIARVEVVPDKTEQSVELEALMRNVLDLFTKIVALAPQMPDELQIAAMNLKDANKMADLIAANLNMSVAEKQSILETIDTRERLKKLSRYLTKELEVLELGSKIQSQVKTEIDKTQREYVLREQMKAIQKELGDSDERTLEIAELQQKVKEAKMPEPVEKEAVKELNRLSKMPPAAAEYTVSRTYLDWLVTLPWSKSTVDNLDIKQAQVILEEDHYDLEKIKERILEYLSVRKLKADMKGPILCFLGPPGVGKTSLGKSIARAIGRKFVRLSLGGVRDEAEIRGHRRTYIGALPGRIIQWIRTAESNNPVFMLDEVDKIGVDFRGDPAAALLEVLDPEQNFSFADHYLDVPFDLSKVMFITTANILDTIPSALRDRMEVLHLPGYTEEEKLEIAKKYLMPKQINENGLNIVPDLSGDDPDKSGTALISFADTAIQKIISDYTREAGVRNLEREIGNICRKVARRYAESMSPQAGTASSANTPDRRSFSEVGSAQPLTIEQKIAPVAFAQTTITAETLSDYLGPAKFFPEAAERQSEIGVATGLAWTQAGGEILNIESTRMRGKKGLTLTGQLGEVMKESAQAALSYVRSRAKILGISEDFYENYDIHIHVPAGAIPKDGPSAGITMATSLASIMTGKPVRHDIAMTGEITLRGKVLPIGGVKEKVLAARRAGIKTVILPKKNEKDLTDVPANIQKEMRFVFVETMDNVLKEALVDSPMQPVEPEPASPQPE
ncbi:MAG: endopeptidase La [bacterium]|nr:endopeptidase La [bacterium]